MIKKFIYLGLAFMTVVSACSCVDFSQESPDAATRADFGQTETSFFTKSTKTETQTEAKTESKAAESAGPEDEAPEDSVVNPYASPGNINNSGYVAEDAEWVYYDNPDDGWALYKVRKNGEDKTLIDEDEAFYINVAGDWIYYVDDSSNSSLYKIRTDGTEKERLLRVGCYSVTVYKDWIYYITEDDGYIYRIRTDGTENTLIEGGHQCYDLNIYGDRLYYAATSDDYVRCGIYSANADGDEKLRLINGYCYYVNVADGWIYYQNDSEYGYIYKIRTDGTEETRLNEEDSYDLNVYDGWIYYTLYNAETDTTEGMCRIKTDGTGRTFMNSEDCYDLNIADGWIYYLTYDGKINRYFLFKCRVDGTGRKLVN